MPDLQAFKSNGAVACRLLSQCSDQNLSICFFCGLSANQGGSSPDVKKN
jgi:hypothetical protein